MRRRSSRVRALPERRVGISLRPPGRPGGSMFKWNPADYAANSSTQMAWAKELIARLSLRGDERILDVGCGDGQVTALLARAVSRGRVVGCDSSPEMVAHAREQHRRHNLQFALADARDLRLPGKFDVLFSNAALHWVDDHRAFLRGAATVLRTGGRLMISCGGCGNAAEVFAAVRAELRRAVWRDCFRRMESAYFFHRAEEYHAWLTAAGFKAERVRLAEKDGAHPGREGFAAWFLTTWLPYTQRVPEDRREAFVTAVTDRYLTKHPPDAAGAVHVRMVRLEIEAVRTETG